MVKKISQKTPENGLDEQKSITSMVLGIISVPTSFIPFVGLVLGILAIYYYRQANMLMKTEPQKYGGKGMAIAGLVTGIIGTAMGAFYLIFWIFYAFIIFAFLSAGV